MEERRSEERRHDPDAWSPDHRRHVRMLYGLTVGGALVFAGIVILSWAAINDRMDLPVLSVSGGLVVVGLIAGLPNTFLPVFSALLKKVPWGRQTTENVEALKTTTTLRALPTDDEG